MKAIMRMSLEKGALELRDVPIPEYGEHDVLIKVKAMGICGTDAQIYAGEYDTNIPIIIGHEFSGEVVAIGSQVENFAIGDRVSSEMNLQSCRWCVDCRQGNYHLCQNRRAPGIMINGTFAEYVALPDFILHKVPDNITYEEGALMEPTAVVTHALLERAPVTPEDFVVIEGPGTLGLLAIQLARYCGARKILVAGRDIDRSLRLHLSLELGADHVINIDKEDVRECVYDLTDGRGADFVLDCVGSQLAVNNGIDMLKKHGKFCSLGMPGEQAIGVPWKKAIYKDMNLIFSYSSSTYSWNIVRSLMERGVVQARSIITQREEIGNFRNAFESLYADNSVKTVMFHKNN